MADPVMNRNQALEQLRPGTTRWDVVIVGGGATGLGCALDAAARGYRTALFERGDFGSGTSSRSTKLIHGGVRYLRRGNLFLVREALRERGYLLANAPHIVHPIPFLIPTYRALEKPWYAVGLALYDALAGVRGIEHSRPVTREEALERAPTIRSKGLRGGVVYHDAQFDDARLAVALARTAAGKGALLANYARVTEVHHGASTVTGVRVEDTETGEVFDVPARIVINATGVFSDEVARMDDPSAEPLIRPSRGVHIVVGRPVLPASSAVLIPHTDDRRVLFLIPWEGGVLVGTTDTPLSDATEDPVPSPEEIDYLIAHANRYLASPIDRDDIRGAFAGLRPLVAGEGQGDDTSHLSREHTIGVSHSEMITVTGGKWTTYRKMAEDAVDQAAFIGGLDAIASTTRQLRLQGHEADAGRHGRLARYGSDAVRVAALEAEGDGAERLAPDLPLTRGEVRWFVEYEMARTVEDVLARRTRILSLDARAALQAAPEVASILSRLCGRDEQWRRQQIETFSSLVRRSLPADAAL